MFSANNIDLNLLDKLYKSFNRIKVIEVILGSTESLKIRIVKKLKVT